MDKHFSWNLRLRRERERHGWSQEQVAAAMKIDPKTIGRWERGEAFPSLKYRNRLCKIYKKSAQELGLIREEPEENKDAVFHFPPDQDTSSSILEAPIPSTTIPSLLPESMNMPQNKRIGIDAVKNATMGNNFLVEEWREAPDIGNFYGRYHERAILEQWIIMERCRVVAVLGIGGIGKTTLTAKVATQMKNQFEYIFWRSLQNAPPLKNILRSCIQFLSDQRSIDVPDDEDSQITLLIEYLRDRRCLVVLDNVESVLQGGHHTRQYLKGYEGYGKLIQRVGEGLHQSCLLLTSREKLKELIPLEGNTTRIHSLHLTGLGEIEGAEILKDKGLFGSEDALSHLIDLYSGNPLALKLVSEPICELFGGNVAEFLNEGETIVDNVYDLLDQQFLRLSELEQAILYWLAIEREPISLDDLRMTILLIITKREILAALESLRQRSMIETTGIAHFALQPVILEYVTERFIEQVFQEIDTETMKLFATHVLIKAQAKDYLRDSQVRLILIPLAERLLSSFGKAGTEEKLKRMLFKLRQVSDQTSNYGAGNILNLLIQLKVDLRGYDVSHLTVRQAYLQGVSLPYVNFAYADLETSVFTDTFGSIFSVALSSNGKLLAAGVANGEVRWWNATSGTPLYTGQAHTDWVRSVVFSNDGKTIVSGSYDQTIRLWNVDTGECFKILQGHSGRIYSVAVSPDGQAIVSGSGDQTIRLWDVSTGECLKTLYGHHNGIYSVAFSTDGQTIVSGSEDKTIRLWDVSTGKCLKILQGHQSGIWSVTFNPDGQTVISGGADQTIRIWEVNTGECLKTLEGHTNRVWSIALSPDGKIILSGGGDRTIRLWEVNTGECLKTLEGHNSWIWSIALSLNGEMLASGGEDQTIRLWKVSTGECLKTLQGHNSWVYSVAFSADGNIILSGGGDRAIRLWKVSTGECLKILHGHNSWVYSVAFSADGKTIASGSEDQTVCLWDIRTGECLKTLHEHSSWVRSVAFSLDGKIIASGSEDKTVRLWDVSTGECIKVLPGHSNWVRSVAFSADGKTIASGSEDQTIRLWDIRTGKCLNVLQGHTSRVYAVALSPDSKLLASGSGDRTIKFWDVSTGQCLKTVQGYSSWVRSVAFSPDGKLIVTGSADQAIRVWEVSTGQCLKILQGHNSWVYSVIFNPDGKTVVSGSGDGTIKLWDIQMEKCIQTLRSDRPYECMNITNVRGLTPAQKAALKALGAIETERIIPAYGFLERLQNNYYVLRHGKSKANETEVILSSPDEGITAFGLTEEGKEQVRKSIQAAMKKKLFDSSTIIYSSDFERCRETAEIVQGILGCDTIHLSVALRERFFGAWEKTHHSNYQKVWENDSKNPERKINEVETTAEVLRRTTSLIMDLEARYRGCSIMLISHGDVLQILQTAFENFSSGDHRQLQQIENAEVRKLN